MIKFLSNLFSGLDPNPIPETADNFKASDEQYGNFVMSAYDNWFGDHRQTGGKTAEGLSTYKADLIIDHYGTRQNARAIVARSTEARTQIKRSNDYAYGKGPRLDPTPERSILGITADQARQWGEEVSKRFHLWASSKDSDATGTNTFYQNIRLAAWMKKRENDVFIRLTYSDDEELSNPLQISFIDPNQIRGDEFTNSEGPDAQDTRIVCDKNGKEIAYKVWIPDDENPGHFIEKTIPARDENTGRLLMLHMFTPEYAGQKRGISEYFHAIQDFEDIGKYVNATLTRAINGASMNYTVENEIQDPSDAGLPNIDDGSAGLPTEADPGATATVTGPTNVDISAVQIRKLPEATTNTPGINLLASRQGDKIKALDDMSPSETSSEFTENRFERLSASFGNSPEIMSMKFGSSFAAGKAAFGLQDNSATIDRSDTESDVSNPIFEMWLSEEIAAGRIKAPGFSDPILKKAWLKNRWEGPPRIDLNPMQTINAIEKALKLRLTDFDSESQKLNSSSGPANRAKVIRQIEEMDYDPFETKQAQQITQDPEPKK